MADANSYSALVAAGVVPGSEEQLAMARPGVWLKALRAHVRLRDGRAKTDPVREVGISEPTWFDNLAAAQFMGDKDVVPFTGLPRPAAAKPVVLDAAAEKAKAEAEAAEKAKAEAAAKETRKAPR